MAGADLSGVSFVKAILLEADLTGARLVGAVFEGADLRSVSLRGATGFPTETANTDGARGELVTFFGARMHRATLHGSRLGHERMAQHDLTDPNLPHSPQPRPSLSLPLPPTPNHHSHH